jgi:poly(A) polymerase
MSVAIAPAWLSAPPTRAVLDALRPAAPLFVGGCVRDALMGIEAADVDLCVATPPERTVQLLEAAGLRAVPTGIDHGTVTAVAGGRGFEVTTLRRDVATDGRRAVVAFTEDVAEDAARRDFTVNALYADAEGAVIDPLGGLPDLEAGRVRFVGEPARRIAEDYLRVLRFFRFTARLSRVGVDAEGLAACAAAVDGLAGLSRERVGQEMKRLLATVAPVEAVRAMGGAGVLEAVAPWTRGADLGALSQAEAAAHAEPRWQRRLAALGPTGEAPAAWRLSKAEARALAALDAAMADAAEIPPAGLAFLHGAEAARDAVLLRAAEGAPLPEGLEAALAAGAAASFPVDAAAVQAAGVERGPALGATLAALRRRWAAGGCVADRAALLAAVGRC